ncbi:MAG: hypothetical protein ABS36_00695 [Acidobacteria bacterium SCN 69-37]|nr:MAG: hypothetical protein ABS36_00695 [Acidobacteria bacterium SCN 69-37]
MRPARTIRVDLGSALLRGKRLASIDDGSPRLRNLLMLKDLRRWQSRAKQTGRDRRASIR